MTDGSVLRMERTYDAPAQTVFDAWTSEEVMRRWWHAGRDWETPVAQVDLRVGGAIRVVMRNPHEDIEYGGGGEYTEVDPPRRLAFTWTWDGDSTGQLMSSTSRRAPAPPQSASPIAVCGMRNPGSRTRMDGAGRSTTSPAR